jgi:hypothetical protein
MTLRNLIATLLIATLLAGFPAASFAKTMTVEVTGQAAESGLGRATTRLRALEAALIEAAIVGGADITGYAAASNGILVSDRLILRPASRILDYRILSEKEANGFYIVSVRAVVGDPPVAILDPCARRAELDIVMRPLLLNISPTTPAWVANIGPSLQERITATIGARPGVRFMQATSAAPVMGRSAQVGRDIDYATLMSAPRSDTSAPMGRFTLHAEASVQMQGQRRIALTLRTWMVESAIQAERASTLNEHVAHLSSGLPIRALDVLASPDRAEVIETLIVGVTAQITNMIDSYACQPLEGVLQLSGDRLTLPFGSKDGLTRHHLAFSEGRETPYTLFEIVTLEDYSTVVRPIDLSRSAHGLAGMKVRFMEITQ